ncbi:GGDEF domain-containing protein [Alginatibacterium sediminis]|uniref:diguanylate cyclase n=1 Tax=Alginatibacterium sediminis TaxID=2164068 RepID=A0A420EFQ4_9ALTE|nr:GGDEF domain-containing protein [Alginatibacterium sediminis]RKF19532.1 GGDEF domain-containing protein [Alginatibacterium sediminis]
MVQILSLPLIITSSISLILGFFFMLLYYRLRSRYEEAVEFYFLFSLSALVSGVFLGAFAVLINSADNLDALNISNRVSIITAMFTIVLGLHFYVSFFNYKAPVFLKWCYAICTFFSLLAIVPNPYFLDKAFYPTSEYYTGLAFGPLFQLWGAWVLILAAYCIVILIRVYIRQHGNREHQSMRTVQLLLVATIVWMITGVSDTLTGIQVLNLPPLTWIGSFLVTCCIAWILVLHIDNLYEDRRQLSNQLMYDHLTQAFSRSYFEIRLAEALSVLDHSGSTRLYLCIFDVDNFKTVNDRYGHANGDELLKSIASITKETIRSFDCFARLGGDEFVLLLTDLQQDSHAINLVERIRHRIAETKIGISHHKFNATCSFGMVCAGPEHIEIKDLALQMLSYADQALYRSKNQGKNTLGIAKLPLGKSEVM